MIRLIRWLLGLCNHTYQETQRHWLKHENTYVGQRIEFRCTKCGAIRTERHK